MKKSIILLLLTALLLISCKTIEKEKINIPYQKKITKPLYPSLNWEGEQNYIKLSLEDAQLLVDYIQELRVFALKNEMRGVFYLNLLEVNQDQPITPMPVISNENF